MLEFCADDFCQSILLIAQFRTQVSCNVKPTNGSYGLIGGALGTLAKHCEPLGLISTLAQIRRVQNMVDGNMNYTADQMATAIMEVSIRVTDELQARKIFIVSSERNAYVTGSNFDTAIAGRFPDAIDDMNEAASCFAFERPTACIFHLMRVTEYGLKEIAGLLNITDHSPTWEPIIRKIDAELKADYKDRQHKGDQAFLANASTHLHAVKVAWRNPTMHIEKINTMEHAKEIYDATAGFMRYMAQNLPQRKPGIVQAIRGKLGV